MRFLIFLLITSLSVLGSGPAASGTGTSGGAVLRFGVMTPAPPARVFEQWSPTAVHLQRQLGIPVELVIPRGLEDAVQQISDGNMDVLYINAYAFHLLKQRQHARALVQMMNLAGSTTSQGRFVVRKESGLESIEDLNGKSMALISPLGAGAYLAPRAYLREHDLDIERDLSVTYTRDLVKATYMVMLEEVEVAVMCGVNYRILSDKLDTGDLRILDSTHPFPEAVIAARSGLDPELSERVQAVLLSMDKNPAGRKALEPLHDLKIQRFVEYDPQSGKTIETMMQQADL